MSILLQNYIPIKYFEFYNDSHEYSILETYFPKNPIKRKIQYFVILTNLVRRN